MPDESTKRKQFAVQREEQAKAKVQQKAQIHENSASKQLQKPLISSKLMK